MIDSKNLAIKLFNETWDLIEKENRSMDEEALMIHKAHASLYHWLQAGTPLHEQRGEWMVSHVYAVIGRYEPAIYHAKRCMALTQQHKFDDFDLTFAYEALARAYLTSDYELFKTNYDLAVSSLSQIKKQGDRDYAKSQLDQLNELHKKNHKE